MADVEFSFELNDLVLMSVMSEVTDTLESKLKEKASKICERLAKDVGEPIAQRAFGSAVRLYSKATKEGWKIIADGGAIVCFLEFGTGADTDSKHPFASKVPFRVSPGSWSDSEFGAGTWSDWIDSGEDPAKYPLNKKPRRGMYLAYKAICDNVERIAIEVLLNDTD